LAARGKLVVDAGGVVVEILQTSAFAEPTEEQLDNWINTYDIGVTSVIDRDPDAETETFTALGDREQVFILDVSTMTVVYQFDGNNFGTPPASTVAANDDILQRLAQ
jgi:hypothetical protein